MSLYVVAYDISDDKRRERVARVLLHYGERMQRSVYQVVLEPDEVPLLCREVGAHLSPQDTLHILPIDLRDARRRLSWQHPFDDWEPVRCV